MTLLERFHGPYFRTSVSCDRFLHASWLYLKLRSVASENFNELIFGIFDGHGQVPTRGLIATQRFALDARLRLSIGLMVSL